MTHCEGVKPLTEERAAPSPKGILGWARRTLFLLREDIENIFAEDPAAKSTWEIIFSYPGFHAIWLHRLAHFLWQHNFLFLGRLLSHINRFLTGIEIHPGAKIGRRLFIDHGMGVVVGETAEIGDDVLIYKGVVLGGTSREKTKRHPTVGNCVVLGSNAVVLGPVTIGDDAKIGSGSVVVKPVPPGATVVGVPGRVIKIAQEKPILTLDHGRLPDPVVEALEGMDSKIASLEERVRQLESVQREAE